MARAWKRNGRLIAKDPEFKALVDEHRQLDEKLKELDRKVYCSRRGSRAEAPAEAETRQEGQDRQILNA